MIKSMLRGFLWHEFNFGSLFIRNSVSLDYPLGSQRARRFEENIRHVGD